MTHAAHEGRIEILLAEAEIVYPPSDRIPASRQTLLRRVLTGFVKSLQLNDYMIPNLSERIRASDGRGPQA
jgi:hypothetical protein